MNGLGRTLLRARVSAGRMSGPQRALFVGNAALVAACLGLVVSAGEPQVVAGARVSPPPEAPLVQTVERPESPFVYDAIVERNPFDPSRRPSEAGGVEAEAAPPAPPPPPPRLYGTTVVTGSPRKAFAIIEADPTRPGPERYREGDRIGALRVRSVRARRVVLSDGRVLTLRPDSIPGAGGETP